MRFLSATNLSKTFRERNRTVDAVKDISFSVDEGEMVALLGPNGAGKTTIIKCILGLVRPDSGEIMVDGVDCRRCRSPALRRMAAVLEGARNTYWRLTTWENISYFAGIHGISERRGKEYFEYLIDLLKLRKERDIEVRNLSSGFKQRVAVACALAKKTPLVFLDEPTLGLDVESSYELRQALKKLRAEERRTIIISSHDMHAVQDTCQRAIIVSHGQIVADQTIPDLLSLFATRKYRITVTGGSGREVGLSGIQEAVALAFSQVSFRQVGEALEFTVSLANPGDIYLLVDVLRDREAVVDAITREEVDLEKAFLEIVGRTSSTCGA